MLLSEGVGVLYHLEPIFAVLLKQLVELFVFEVFDLQFCQAHLSHLSSGGYDPDYGEDRSYDEQ